MINLSDTQVTFDATSHTYSIGGIQLNGITKRIKERVCPDKYADIPDYILEMAAEAGTRMHHAVELYAEMGIETDDYPELQGYIKEEEHFPFMGHFLTSEYLVTDSKKYASAIDLIYEDPTKPGHVVLADLKRTSQLDIEYVSWQLSVYARFFSMANPDVPISALYVIHLRNDTHQVVKLERKSDELVDKMLYTEEYLPLPIAKTDDKAFPAIASAERTIANMMRNLKQTEERIDKLKKGMEAIMQENNIKKYDGKELTITLAAPSKVKTFDSKAFKEEYPDIYEAFCKTSERKGGIRFKIKE